MDPQIPQTAKEILGNNKAGDISLPIANYTTQLQQIKQYCTGIKMDTYLWNRTESPEINSAVCSQLIFDKRAKNTLWGNSHLFDK